MPITPVGGGPCGFFNSPTKPGVKESRLNYVYAYGG